jgi:hypothetical protein
MCLHYIHSITKVTKEVTQFKVDVHRYKQSVKDISVVVICGLVLKKSYKVI